MMNSGAPVASPIRVSTASQAEDDRAGLARQREVIRRTVAARHLNCVKEVEITDVSGTSVKECPEIQQLLQDVRLGRLSGIVVADLDRLVRPVDIEDLALLQVFQDTGAILFCGDQELDLSSESGYLMGGIQALLAGHELRLIKKRMLGGKEMKRRQGKCPNSHITLPFGVGYDRKQEKHFYSDDIAGVKEAFRLLDEGSCQGMSEVAARIGLTPRGLHCVLRNKIYIGIREYTKKRGPKYPCKGGRQGDRHKVPRDPEQIISVRVIDEPAVPTDRFYRVQALLDMKRGIWTTSRTVGRVHLGTGILRCGHCGSTLNCKSGHERHGQRKRGYYVCKQNDCYWRRRGSSCEQPGIPEDEIESLLVEFVSRQLSDEVFLQAVIAHHVACHNDGKASAASLQVSVAAAVNRLSLKLARMEELYYQGGYKNAAEYMAKRSTVASELDETRSRLMPGAPARTKSLKPMIGHIVRGALAFGRCQDRIRQKQIVRAMLSEVVVRDDAIVAFKLTPPLVMIPGCERNTRTDKGSWLPRA